eukprot:1162041-Prymnesium_polylepis.1
MQHRLGHQAVRAGTWPCRAGTGGCVRTGVLRVDGGDLCVSHVASQQIRDALALICIRRWCAQEVGVLLAITEIRARRRVRNLRDLQLGGHEPSRL